MTAPGTERRGLLNEIGAAITNVAVPHHEPPAVVLCRRIVVVIVLVIGAALLGLSLSRTPGESRTGRVPRSPALSAGRAASSYLRRYDDLYSNSPNIASLGMRPQSCPAR
jgi:hypothetical protein